MVTRDDSGDVVGDLALMHSSPCGSALADVEVLTLHVGNVDDVDSASSQLTTREHVELVVVVEEL
eukprot:6464543-Amphidinium_carterae.3